MTRPTGYVIKVVHDLIGHSLNRRFFGDIVNVCLCPSASGEDFFHNGIHIQGRNIVLRKQELARLKKELGTQDYNLLKGSMWALRKETQDLTQEENQTFAFLSIGRVLGCSPDHHIWSYHANSWRVDSSGGHPPDPVFRLATAYILRAGLFRFFTGDIPLGIYPLPWTPVDAFAMGAYISRDAIPRPKLQLSLLLILVSTAGFASQYISSGTLMPSGTLMDLPSLDYAFPIANALKHNCWHNEMRSSTTSLPEMAISIWGEWFPNLQPNWHFAIRF